MARGGASRRPSWRGAVGAASAVLALAGLGGCLSSARSGGSSAGTAAHRWPWPDPVGVADSVRTTVISPAVRLHEVVWTEAPWRGAVLEVDLAGCVTLRAVKGHATAVGRSTTSALLDGLAPDLSPLAAVNADFFSFTPPGVPTGAHVEDGRVLAGPGTRPVFAIDSAGRAFIGTLSASGEVTDGRSRVPIVAWNRWPATGAAVLDRSWGVPLDSVTEPEALALVPAAGAGRYRVVARGGRRVPLGDTVLLVVPADTVRGSASIPFAIGASVRLVRSLGTPAPREAVGGFPVLLASGRMPAALATAGAASFRGVNPRTAVGLDASGRRLWLAVLDGRRDGWSVGTTLEETARVLQALGATEAINLDGGGSSALVVREPATGMARVVTRPSDPGGERAVGNALAVLGSCAVR